jgi:hypothetical protein
LISILKVKHRNGKWFIEDSSEEFNTRQEALERITQMRTKKMKRSNVESRKFFSEKVNIYFRSSWEVELAELLHDLGIDFDFEPERFFFDREKESYLPDFYLPEYNCWIEVKGFMDKRSERRCKLFKRYFGAETGYFLYMKEERELILKQPQLLYTYIQIAQEEQERVRREKEL